MFLGWSSGVLAASATSIAIGAGAGIIFLARNGRCQKESGLAAATFGSAQ